MRPRATAASTLVVATLAWPSSSPAQDLGAQALFTGSVGVTDNIANAPSIPTAPDQPGPQADVLIGLSPGVALLYETPRTSTRLAYALGLTLYGAHREANSYTNSASLATRVETTPTTTLFLGITGEQGQLNALVAASAQGAAQATQAVPPGDTVYYRASAQEGFELALSEAWTATQSTSYAIYLPNEGQRAHFLDNALGLQRTWEVDTGSVTLAVGYTQYEPHHLATGELVEGSEVVLDRGTLGWSHAYSNEFSSQVNFGVVLAMRVDGGQGDAAAGPIGSASLRYARDELESSLTYSHDLAPNVLLGTHLFTDAVAAHVAVPIAATYVTASTTGTVSRARELNARGQLGPPQHHFTVQAALLWAPLSTRGNIQVGLQYEASKQVGDDHPPAGFVPIQDTMRNTVLATVALAWPDVAEATAPPLMSAPFRPRPQGDEDIERGPTGGPSGPRGPSGPTSPSSPGGT